MVYCWEGSVSDISYIDCPKCEAEKSIKVDKCTIPGYRCTDYEPCCRCGYDPHSPTKS